MDEDNRDEEDRLGTAPLSPRAFPVNAQQRVYSPRRHHYDYSNEPHMPHTPQVPHVHQVPHIPPYLPSTTTTTTTTTIATHPFDHQEQVAQHSLHHYHGPATVPIASYAAANSQAIAANASTSTAVAPLDPFTNPSDPDDFYREYRGVQTGVSASRLPISPQSSLMASTTVPHHHPLPQGHQPHHTRPTASSSIRSDSGGHGASSPSSIHPHPAFPPGHSGLRPGFRSTSNPVDDKLGRLAKAVTTSTSTVGSGYAPSKQPSVKDLKKRFDQTASASVVPTAARKIVQRNTTKDGHGLPVSAHGRPAGVGAGSGTGQAASYSALRSSTARDAGASSTSRGTQRQKFVEEDQLSNNPQSFASRVGNKQRTASQPALTKEQDLKATARSPEIPPTSPNRSGDSARPNGLLFGEILPQEGDAQTAGYGIEGAHPRRTSEPSVFNPPGPGQPKTAEDVDAASPTDWYRGAASAHQAKASKIPQGSGHLRAYSDVAPGKPTISTSRRPGSRQAPARGLSPTQPPSPSRLPLSVKKLSTSSSPSSPSTRSNSPSSVQQFPASGRTSRQHIASTAARAKTPTTRSTTPTTGSKTPTHSSTHQSSTALRKGAPGKIATPSNSNNTRLAAFISAPPPKLSPPLRSSRPRQPVSSASTASSRLKAVDKAPAAKQGIREDEATARRRKISVGPIDFAQRRETIKLAYSKSIRETKEREARQAAAHRRKREMEAAAKAKAEAEAAAGAMAAEATLEKSQTRDAATEVGVDMVPVETTGPVEKPLRIETTVPESSTKPDSDSPTLGIPGSFPSLVSTPRFEEDDHDVPLSAVSNVSAVTEFDVEAQTEPPVPEPSSNTEAGLGIQQARSQDLKNPEHFEACRDSHGSSSHEHNKTTYRSPFDDEGIGIKEDRVSIKISLDSSSLQQAQAPASAEISSLSSSGGAGFDGPQESPQFPGSFHSHLEKGREDSSARSSPRPEGTFAVAEQDCEPEVESQQLVDTTKLEQEYEPRPFLIGNQQTIVTILGRDSDFRPLDHTDDHDARRHLERYRERRDERQDRQDQRASYHEPQMDNLEDFYVGPNMKDNVSTLRDSTFMSSEFSDDQVPSSTEAQRTPDTSQSLTIPGLLSPANRTSQHSAWTDFSLDSSDGGRDNVQGSGQSHTVIISRDSTLRGRPATLPLDSFADGSKDEDGFRYSPELDGVGESLEATEEYADSHRHKQRHHDLHHNHNHNQHLPELDTGDGFSVDYLTRAMSSSSVPIRPDHEPPPIPTPDNHSVHDGRRTPSSGFYDQTRPSSYFQSSKDDESTFSVGPSRRESEDYTQTMLTPQSADQTSLDSAGLNFSRASTLDVDQKTTGSDEAKDQASEDKQSPSGKEKSRLTQRQNVIKELIDTEMVFVRDMNIIEEIYKGTAEACPRLDSKTVKLIFRNTDEIIAFHTVFLSELKDSVASVYSPKGRRSPLLKETKDDSIMSDSMTVRSMASSSTKENKDNKGTAGEPDDVRDRQTVIGPVFSRNVEQMRMAHEGFLRSSDQAAKRLIQIQEDRTVKLWLDECNEVAKDLTAAWNLDSLLIKPMQRITKYPNLIIQLLQYTPEDHPDREALIAARTTLENAILDINKTKKNFELVGQIVGRKRKESDVRAGFARAFGKRVDKLQASSHRVQEDAEYQKLIEKFGDDYLRLQVVLRDVEFYTRQISAYVHEFLQFLSAMELVMRLQPSPFPEIESKWARFNVSMRDMEKVALDQHLAQVRKHVIEPFELVIRCYNNPSTAMKKRAKRRLDFERAEQLKKGGKKVDKQLAELVEQYDALNETLKKELPKLSAHTETIGNICLGNFVCIQVKWFSIWKEKVKVVLGDAQIPEFADVVTSFQREFRDMEEQVGSIGLLNPSLKPRTSQSTTATDESLSISISTSRTTTRSRPSDLSPRGRGLSVNSDTVPTLPTPDFVRGNSSQFSLSPTAVATSPHHYYYRDQYSGLNTNGYGSGSGSGNSSIRPGGSASPITPGLNSTLGGVTTRPSTGRSYDSSSAHHRPSVDSTVNTHSRRESASGFTHTHSHAHVHAHSHSHTHAHTHSTHSNYPPPPPQQQESRRFSGLFHSALPPEENDERQQQHQQQQRSSRASSRERPPPVMNGYNVMWLAASLFEFKIEDTKHEAGYPYLTYQAGEIFDVIAEKGELWLAKNQDDPASMVGWIWSKHFAKLADS